MRIREVRVPPPLLALLAAATVLSVAWTAFTTTFQAPDESAHVAYVQHLAETGDGPDVRATAGQTLSSEAEALVRWQNLDSTVGLTTGRPGWSAAEVEAWRRVQGSERRDDGAGPNPLAQNPPLYYLYEAVPYLVGSGWSLPTRMLLMRLANLPLLWITIACAWVALGELFRGRAFVRTVGTGAVALLPMLGFLSGVVNPEIALTAVATAAIALALVALRVGPRPAALLGLGALGAAAVLVHGRGLALLPPIVLVLALVLWRARHARGLRWGALSAAGAVAIMGVGLLLAVAYSSSHAGSTSFSGELNGSASSGVRHVSGLFAYTWQFYLSPLVDQLPPPGEGIFGYRQVFVEQFLTGAFGSLEVRYATGVYRALQIAQGIGLIVLLGVVVRHWERVRAHAPQAIVLLAFLVSMLALLHVAAWQDLSVPPYANLLTGRYLVPLVALFGIAVAVVVDGLPARPRVVLGSAVLASAAALSVGGIALTVVRFYV